MTKPKHQWWIKVNLLDGEKMEQGTEVKVVYTLSEKLGLAAYGMGINNLGISVTKAKGLHALKTFCCSVTTSYDLPVTNTNKRG